MKRISVMKSERSTIFRAGAFGMGLLASVTLAGCGGDSSPSVQASAFPSCSNAARVPSVDGYPVYRVQAGDVDKCAVAAHYDAGYAIVADRDIDIWGPTDDMPVFKVDSGVAATEPTGINGIISTVAVASSIPIATKSEQSSAFILAKSAVDGTPVECEIQGGPMDADGIDRCLAPVRTSQLRQRLTKSAVPSAAVRAAAESPAGITGNANPDPSAWTLLGNSSQEVSLESFTDNWWQSDQKAGSAQIQFSVYRLNSSTHNDYYLVKANWETSPQPRINKTHPTRKDTCVKGDYCGYYNNLHDMAFSLSVVRGGVSIQGNIDNYMPKTVERNTTVTQKMGGSLSFGEKGISGSVSGEIATSYTYSAQNLISSSEHGIAEFISSHATSASDIWKADPTTVGTAGTVAWVLFSVPEGDPALEESVQIKVSKFEGSFGLRADNDLVSHTYLYDYKLAKPYTISYSTPTFGVKVLNDDGTSRPVPAGHNNAIRLKAGQSTELQISAGDYSTPIRLAWQVTNLPDWIVASVEKGSVNSGNGNVTLTVRPNAAPGVLGYVMINTSPRAAAASMRNQDIAIPIQVVQ
ncbi:TPA: hypothetical protein QDB13_005938 [Burkholderia vietnamiensis]|nr:hypothetical protein [Burkholderia vietnamiensis]